MQRIKHSSDEFTTWLQGKLKELNTDPDIFGSYIIGILDGEEALEEKREALNDILGEIITSDLESLLSVILEKWETSHPKEEVNKPVHIDVNEQLAKLLDAQKLQTISKDRQYSEEERRIREQILAQYSQTEIDDEDAYESEEEAEKTSGNAASSLTGIKRNRNVQDVMALQKEKREQARMDSAAKKQKDKEDRERQKQLREEKKEKRKTVKGERRR